jgi:hypothetical protein
MVEHLSSEPVETIFDTLWPRGKKSLCIDGEQMLRHFAKTRPADIAFLKPGDLVDLKSSDFTGVPEWDAFTNHVSTSTHCKES